MPMPENQRMKRIHQFQVVSKTQDKISILNQQFQTKLVEQSNQHQELVSQHTTQILQTPLVNSTLPQQLVVHQLMKRKRKLLNLLIRKMERKKLLLRVNFHQKLTLLKLKLLLLLHQKLLLLFNLMVEKTVTQLLMSVRNN